MTGHDKSGGLTSYNAMCLWGVLFILVISGCISRLYFGVFVRDQAELIALSQQFAFTYDEQIPVLSWLMTGLFRLTNYFILWPDIYKYICLGLCLFSVFRLTLHITNNSNLALIAALSLFFLPTFHDDMLGEITHTAALLAATALSTDWMVRHTPSQLIKTRPMLILATFWLFGFLAKHTMSFIIIAQVSAYILAFRLPKSGTLRLIRSAGLTCIGITPVYILIASHSATLKQGLEEFYKDEGFTRGLVDLLTSTLTEASLFIVFGLIGVVIFRHRKIPMGGIRQNKKSWFLLLTLCFIVLQFIPFIIVADIAVVRDRWLAPALMLLAPLFATLCAAAQPKHIKSLRTLLIGLACMLGLFRAGEPYFDRLSGDQNIDNAPLALMSKTLRQTYPDVKTYLSPNYNLLATLKYQDPTLRIYTQKTMNLFAPKETESNKLIILSLKHDAGLETLHLDFKCSKKETETISNWSYQFMVCSIL